jgi:hypothetical protein
VGQLAVRVISQAVKPDWWPDRPVDVMMLEVSASQPLEPRDANLNFDNRLKTADWH